MGELIMKKLVIVLLTLGLGIAPQSQASFVKNIFGGKPTPTRSAGATGGWTGAFSENCSWLMNQGGEYAYKFGKGFASPFVWGYDKFNEQNRETQIALGVGATILTGLGLWWGYKAWQKRAEKQLKPKPQQKQAEQTTSQSLTQAVDTTLIREFDQLDTDKRQKALQIDIMRN